MSPNVPKNCFSSSSSSSSSSTATFEANPWGSRVSIGPDSILHMSPAAWIARQWCPWHFESKLWVSMWYDSPGTLTQCNPIPWCLGHKKKPAKKTESKDMITYFLHIHIYYIEGLPPMPPTPNRGDSKVGCGRSKQWFGDGWQVSGILQPFCVDAHRSQKTAETLLLEPTKNKEKKSPQAKQTFAQRKTWKPASHQAKLKKKVFGTRMRKGRTPAGFVPKPLRNRSRKNAETSLLEPIKKRKK